jgi:ELWxxDGT repeat protein
MLRKVVFFQGTNASGGEGLWETDGTAAGTFELTAVPPGLAPTNLTALKGQVLFNGVNAAGHPGLWATDGTAAGTAEITGIDNVDVSGLDPSGLTLFQGQVLFNGVDLVGRPELWTTNGTASGTSELTLPDSAGAAATGLNPSDLTLFKNEVFFNGDDSRSVSGPPGHAVSGLWVTNGTAAGTSELVPGAGPSGLNPYDMTVFGADMLFGGTNASGLVGLWETDGTAGGTQEITVIAGANPSLGLTPNFLTVLGGDALFSGLDTSGDTGLWRTDGTGPDTTEVTGIKDINGVVVPDLTPRFLTGFNGEVLFNGRDSNGVDGLWETNGTVGGTQELLAFAPGGGGGSDPTGLDPSGFELFNGEVLFSGKDASGKQQLWETNGTAAGTHELASTTTGLAPLDLTAVVPANLLWQNTTSGQASIWELNGGALIGGGPVSPNPGPSWKAIGTADFFGGGSTDILWQNTSTGQASIWENERDYFNRRGARQRQSGAELACRGYG